MIPSFALDQVGVGVHSIGSTPENAFKNTKKPTPAPREPEPIEVTFCYMYPDSGNCQVCPRSPYCRIRLLRKDSYVSGLHLTSKQITALILAQEESRKDGIETLARLVARQKAKDKDATAPHCASPQKNPAPVGFWESVTCYHCGKVWVYTGGNDRVASCPRCDRKVYLSKARRGGAPL